MYITLNNDFIYFKNPGKIFDVFKGTEWENHTRFQRVGQILKLVSGQPVTADEYKLLNKELK